MKSVKVFRISSIILLAALALAVAAGSWVHLGTRTVNYGLDHDRVLVNHPGVFTKIKINVSGSLNMHQAVVHYANGSSQQLSIKHQFRRGSDSRVIDLNGNKRVIGSVSLWYDTKNRSRRKARVHLYARR